MLLAFMNNALVSAEIDHTTTLIEHYRAVEVAERTGRKTLAQAQELNTFVYDAIDDQRGDPLVTDAAFWAQVATLEESIRAYQHDLHEVGLPFEEKPPVHLITPEGQPILYGDVVLLEKIDDGELDWLESKIQQKVAAVSAEMRQTISEMKQRNIPRPLIESQKPSQLPLRHYSLPKSPAKSNSADWILSGLGRIAFEIITSPFL